MPTTKLKIVEREEGETIEKFELRIEKAIAAIEKAAGVPQALTPITSADGYINTFMVTYNSGLV